MTSEAGEANPMLVISDADRDKLLRLVNTNGAPFYGSQVSRMPPLWGDFIDHVARLLTAQMAQRALESLRARNPARVWKSARGEYAVDDAAMHRRFQQRVGEGRWRPPTRRGG